MTFVTDVSLFLLPVALLRTQKMPDLNNKSLPPNRYFIFLPLHSSLYGSQSKLDFILTYMKENPNQSYHGYLFEMSQSKVSEWVNFIIPSLEEALDRLCLLPQQGDYWDLEQESTDFLSMDVVERQVPRRSDYEAQKEEYSGKKNAIRLSIWRSLTQKARYYS